MDIKEIKIMIEEQYVSIATAKLAKEKGFTGIMCNRCYGNDGQYYSFNVDNIGDEDLGIAAPTQSLLARWLRDKHHLFVTAGFCLVWRHVIIPITDKISCNYETSKETYSSYEEAIEAGLQEALKLI